MFRGAYIFKGTRIGMSYQDMLNILTVLQDTTRNNILTGLFQGVDPRQRAAAINLVSKMLAWNPAQRLTIDQVLTDPLFTDLQYLKIEGTAAAVQPAVPQRVELQLPADFREQLKMISGVLWQRYPGARTRVLFLAIDLLYRVGELMLHMNQMDKTALALATVQMALKMYDTLFNLELLVQRTLIKTADVLDKELIAIHHLGGIIYRPYLYEAATSYQQLASIYNSVIISKENYTKYFTLDITATLAQVALPPTDPGKDITIAQFLAAPAK